MQLWVAGVGPEDTAGESLDHRPDDPTVPGGRARRPARPASGGGKRAARRRRGEPFARTEYQNYVEEVLNCLQHAKSSDEISDLLIDIVENRMGLVFSPEISHTAGKLLFRHKKTIDSDP